MDIQGFGEGLDDLTSAPAAMDDQIRHGFSDTPLPKFELQFSPENHSLTTHLFSLQKPSLNPAFYPNMLIPHHEFQPHPDHYAHFIDIFTRYVNLRKGKTLHAFLITTGLLASSTHLSSKLIKFYIQCKQLHHARKLFDQIPQTKTTRWTFLLTSFSRQGYYAETMKLFAEMLREGVRSNKIIYPSVLRACANLSEEGRTGEIMHAKALRSLCEVDVVVNSSLVYMYSKCGKVEKARLVFDGMVERDMVAWNSMISVYVNQGCTGKALELVGEMKSVGLRLNLVTWNALIAGFSREGDDVMALKLFQMMRGYGFEPDVVSWTSIISGFVQNFRYEKAFFTFKQMMAAGVWPSSFTISCLFAACASTADLGHGREIHGYAVTAGVEEDMFVCSSLVDMYGKCGFIYEAKKLFDKMSERTTVTWNSMIFGYANHGYCSKALEHFNQMLKEEVKPDHLTFTAVLTACSHAGMVALGWNMFDLMQKEYKIVPRVEHYACLVDMLGRAGEVVEAYNFIKRMPIRPDSFVWGALLGACRSYGNVELAEIAAKNLYELEPSSAGSRLMLSNLYADVGKWEEAEKWKRILKRTRFEKIEGLSWIEAG